MDISPLELREIQETLKVLNLWDGQDVYFYKSHNVVLPCDQITDDVRLALRGVIYEVAVLEHESALECLKNYCDRIRHFISRIF